MSKVGPIGEISFGDSWDEMGRKDIRFIIIYHGRDKIYSIQTACKIGGSVKLSARHGSAEESISLVTFDYPSEFLTSVNGIQSGDGFITSITFSTNQRSYGPFGSTSNTSYDATFDYQMGKNFNGFHGYSDSEGLRTIGVYVKPTEVDEEEEFRMPDYW